MLNRRDYWLGFAELSEAEQLGELQRLHDTQPGTFFDVPFCHGTTPLIWALRQRRAAVTHALLQAGVDPDLHGLDGKPPLVCAIESGQGERVKTLLDAGADPSKTDPNLRSPLMYAAFFGDMPGLLALLRTDAPLDAVDVDGRNVLDYAAHRRKGKKHNEIIKRIEALAPDKLKRSRRQKFTLLQPAYRRLLYFQRLRGELANLVLFSPLAIVLFAGGAHLWVAHPLAMLVSGGYAAFSDSTWGDLIMARTELFGEPAVVMGNWISVLLLWLLMMKASTPLSVLSRTIAHSLFASFAPSANQPAAVPAQLSGDDTAAICQLIKAGSRALNERATNDYSTRSGMHARDLVEVEERYIWLLIGYLLLFLGGITLAGLVLSNLGWEYQLWVRSAPNDGPLIAWSTAGYLLLLSYLLIVAARLLLAAGIPLSRREARLVQQERDSAAQQRLDEQQPAARAAEDFVLYLRAFALDGRLSIAGLDLETLIAASLTQAGGVVALGSEPVDTAGAARVAVADGDWQTTVLRLAERAAQVFLIPATSAGTRWEIEMLQQRGWFSKTVFIMPPAAAIGPTGMADLWADLLQRLSLELPPYYGGGAIIRVHDDGSIRDWNALGIDLASWDLKVPGAASADVPWTPLCDEDTEAGGIDDDGAVDEPAFGGSGDSGDSGDIGGDGDGGGGA